MGIQYVPALDGLRAVAVLMVLAVHARIPGLMGGYLGVDVFFVLSGYLITRILLARGIDLRDFYLRRARRLYPALLLLVAAYIAAASIFDVTRQAAIEDGLLSVFYLSDYARAFWERPNHLAHTWSLAVEEHFYILWPLLLAWLIRTRTRHQAAGFMVAVAAGLMLWRLLCLKTGHTWTEVYFRFDTHASGLAAGCALGLYGPGQPKPAWVGWFGAGMLAFAATAFPWRASMGLSQGIPFAEIGTVLVIMAVEGERSSLKTLLGHPWLAYMGRLSYGLYLWHYPIFRLLDGYLPPGELILLGGALSFAFAALSYHTVEAWFRVTAGTPSPSRRPSTHRYSSPPSAPP